jgi:hypothetical protein
VIIPLDPPQQQQQQQQHEYSHPQQQQQQQQHSEHSVHAMREFYAAAWVTAGLGNDTYVDITQNLATMASQGDTVALDALKRIAGGGNVPHTLLFMGLISPYMLEQCGIPLADLGIGGGSSGGGGAAPQPQLPAPPYQQQQHQLQHQHQQTPPLPRPEEAEWIGGLLDD